MRKTDNLLLWLGIVASYFCVVWIFHQIPVLGYSTPILILTTIIAIIATLRPYRRWVRVSIIRLLNPNYFEHIQQLKELKRQLQITQPHEQIIDQVLVKLENIFDARILAIVLENNDQYSIVNYRAPDPINLDNVVISTDSELIKNLINKSGIVKFNKEALIYNPTPQRQQDYRFKEYKLFNYAIPLKVNDHLIGTILTSNLPQEFIRDWENGLLQDFAEYLGIMIRNSKLYNEIRWEALQKNTLLEISKKITSSLNASEVLHLVIDSLNHVVNYNAAGIFLVRSNQNVVHEMVQRGYEPEKLNNITLKVGQGIVGTCIRERRPIIIGDVTKTPQYISARDTTRSEMCVPIYNNGQEHVLGAFNIESDLVNAFSKEDLDRLIALSEQVSIAIENANLYKKVKESKQFERDIEVAREIQSAFLPKTLPQNPQYDFAALCKPSQKVGGDFYDIHQLSKGKIGIAIGDVSGKGIPGAILMANLYAGYRSRVRTQDSIHQMVGRLNDLLVESTNSEKFTTFFYGELDINSDKITYTNGGHNPPLIIHENGEYEELTTGGPVIGALEHSIYEEQTVDLKPGDLLLLYTDGITEAIDGQGQYYEVERLLNIVRRRTPKTNASELMDMIHRDVYNFTRGEDLQDDVTVVIMLVKPEPVLSESPGVETA